MTGFFYPVNRAHHAYCMAKDFDMEFEKRFGKWDPYALLHLSGSVGYRIYVHEDSLPILQPQPGDLVFYDNLHGGEAWDEVAAIITPDDERYRYFGTDEPLMLMDGGEHPYVKELRRIILRRGVPFHYPEMESE